MLKKHENELPAPCLVTTFKTCILTCKQLKLTVGTISILFSNLSAQWYVDHLEYFYWSTRKSSAKNVYTKQTKQTYLYTNEKL